ncbi:uncharacterized protein Z520_08636 [Fonsecaea multimorphosa CBS 102226]|uniref:Transcription factor domain-containing protein n=1 Tax=Fonsecaea multimorphosa CBS 102226 TaxID=1442371 RepID=A0A0D2IEK9_9EURO|nr:uncharacterized protein Z520_08636 [Fonsecaea multimorphosa CBS 102226]KIX95516.1 hypothetical protein Z520_08636 [Fonsecaea multimorphosa CBS 102226]OAL21362.1 hypothetical protein AYO22_08085 [Fonsecaea multimorphosa]
MHFIVTTDVSKADAETQRLIRSQVMRGKNRGKSLRAKQRRSTSWAVEVDSKRGAPEPLKTFVDAYYSAIPGKVGSDLSSIELAAEMDPAAFGDVVRFFDMAARALYPLVNVTGFSQRDMEWFIPLKFDPAYLHVTVFAAEVFMDRVLGRQYPTSNQDATVHFLKGVQILRQRLLLDDESTKFSNSTIAVVLTLAASAFFMGEDETFKHHMVGLRKMVDLRGGIAAFKGNKLLTEMFRCDISMAMQSGSEPVFFNDHLSEPFMPYPDQELLSIRNSVNVTGSQQDSGLLDKMDKSLAEAWGVMKTFCSIVNLAVETQRMLSPPLIYDTMASVMYRLLHMKFDAGSVDEAVRLSLLGLTHHIFLKWQYLRLPYVYFPSIYKSCLLETNLVDVASPQSMLWFLMVGAISAFTTSDHPGLKDCLRQHIDRCEVKSWNEMRGVLKSFMWIGLLHDKPGKDVFDSVFP